MVEETDPNYVDDDSWWEHKTTFARPCREVMKVMQYHSGTIGDEAPRMLFECQTIIRLRTPHGRIERPVPFTLSADSIEEALAKFDEEAKKACDEFAKRLEEESRKAAQKKGGIVDGAGRPLPPGPRRCPDSPGPHTGTP